MARVGIFSSRRAPLEAGQFLRGEPAAAQQIGHQQVGGAAVHPVDQGVRLLFPHLLPADQGVADKAGLTAGDRLFVNALFDHGIGGSFAPAHQLLQAVGQLLGAEVAVIPEDLHDLALRVKQLKFHR